MKYATGLVNHHYHHSQKTSTAAHRPSPSFSKITRPLLLACKGFLQPSPGHRTPLWSLLNAASSGTRLPIKNFMAPKDIVSASNKAPPTYVYKFFRQYFFLSLSPDFLIPDSITHGNTEHCPLHCSLSVSSACQTLPMLVGSDSWPPFRKELYNV